MEDDGFAGEEQVDPDRRALYGDVGTEDDVYKKDVKDTRNRGKGAEEEGAGNEGAVLGFEAFEEGR